MTEGEAAGDAAGAGQVVLVAGGASGLGRAVAGRFLAEGASVAVFDRSADKLAELADAWHGAEDVSAGTSLLTLAGDVRSHDDNRRVVDEVERRFGRLDALVITVGIVDYMASFRDYRPEDWMGAFGEVMAVNAGGPVLLSLVAAPLLAASRGSITFTLSTSAFWPPASGPVYGMSKAALVMAVRQLALDLAPEVRVNGVVPGAVLDTDIRGPESLGQEARVSGLTKPGAGDAIAADSVLGRAPTGDDYAAVYVLLASHRDAAVATGSIISWDAGISLLGHGQLLARRQPR